MKHSVLLMGLLFGGILIGPSAPAADRAVDRPEHALPFPRGERAEAVWASGGCWTACGAYTASALVDCLSEDSQGRCLKRADAGDRFCQRTCRARGGPYLAIE